MWCIASARTDTRELCTVVELAPRFAALYSASHYVTPAETSFRRLVFPQPAPLPGSSTPYPNQECPTCSYTPPYSDTPSVFLPPGRTDIMPSTYPIAKAKDRPPHSSSNTHHLPPQVAPRIAAYPPGQSPSSAGATSRYLSPIQEARIRSWRDHTDPNEAPLPPHPHHDGKKGIKSAPATLAVRSSTSGGEQSSSQKGSTPTRSSSSRNNHTTLAPTRPPPHVHHHSHGHLRSYYSSKKKSSHTSSALTPTVLTSPTPTPTTVMPPGQTMSPEQMAMYAQQGPMTQQQHMMQGPEETAQIPPPVLARAPDLPRIAGARDPISQN